MLRPFGAGRNRPHTFHGVCGPQDDRQEPVFHPARQGVGHLDHPYLEMTLGIRGLHDHGMEATSSGVGNKSLHLVGDRGRIGHGQRGNLHVHARLVASIAACAGSARDRITNGAHARAPAKGQ
jgi:hypothetical protein